MKVVWICNSPLGMYYRCKGINKDGASWIDGLLEKIYKESEVEIIICFPTEQIELQKVSYQGVIFYEMPRYKRIKQYQDAYISILKQEKPDILHVWGTEFAYVIQAIYAAYECNLSDRVVLNIQGMCGEIAKHYYAQLPQRVIYGVTCRDILRHDSVFIQKRNFQKRSIAEKKAIKNVKYVIGRTDCDCAYTKIINVEAKYFLCNEILRPIFYEKTWDYATCEKGVLFVSQAYYPIKGLHFLLEAIALVKYQYPNVKLKIAGFNNVRSEEGIKGKIKQGKYARYISSLIKKYDLKENIFFVGELNQYEMCNEYLNSNVFISASTTENESNSLSEAKMLGMPVIASCVGGINNRIVHQKDGYIYPYDDVFMLAYYIMDIFENPEKAIAMGKAAKEAAMLINDRNTNLKTQMSIYKAILERKVIMEDDE